MYKFTVSNEVIGYANISTYIKKMDNGCYGLCSKEEAEGVAINSKPYSLQGKELDNLPVVEVSEINDTEFSNYVLQTSNIAVELAERVVDLELQLLEV